MCSCGTFRTLHSRRSQTRTTGSTRRACPETVLTQLLRWCHSRERRSRSCSSSSVWFVPHPWTCVDCRSGYLVMDVATLAGLRPCMSVATLVCLCYLFVGRTKMRPAGLSGTSDRQRVASVEFPANRLCATCFGRDCQPVEAPTSIVDLGPSAPARSTKQIRSLLYLHTECIITEFAVGVAPRLLKHPAPCSTLLCVFVIFLGCWADDPDCGSVGH